MTQLTNAVCIELAPSGARREQQLAANKKLVDRAGGLLAEVNGEERYITVGCGHTAAFCKCVLMGGGPTPEHAIQNEDGKIGVQKIKKPSSSES